MSANITFWSNIGPLLQFVKPAVRLISSENLRFSASGGPLGGPPEPPSELVQSILLNVDALVGIAKPVRASVSISIDTLMNAEARACFAPKGLRAFWKLVPNKRLPGGYLQYMMNPSSDIEQACL